jgi:alpha-tubulin suppressor-like RCC1 family protein
MWVCPRAEKGECFTLGSNQHGQMGCSWRRNSRVPFLVPGLQGIAMAACGDAFSLAIGSGEGDREIRFDSIIIM